MTSVLTSYRASPPTFSQFPLIYLRTLLTLPFDSDAKNRLAFSARLFSTGNGYMVEQSTRPQTIGYSLADSPVGLLAWIYEKLVAWTDEYPWTEDEGTLILHTGVYITDASVLVLTWIHIYLFSHVHSTSSAATSVRIYFEATQANDWSALVDGQHYNGQVPMGLSVFPRELIVAPSS